ncbi:M13 family metallopeptidase [Acidobacteria bacterium AB60]|nr:M13 family metallopeptidase [Acidobacteria bacterium AB60]
MSRCGLVLSRCLAACLGLAVTACSGGAQATSSGAAPSRSELKVFDPSLIDASVDPCENFYRFSCNGWFKKNPLPPDQTSYGRFTELAELNRLHLKQILEGAANAHPESRNANEQKIGDEYASCMDTEAIDKAGLAPLKAELDRIATLKSREQLPALLGHLHRMGVSAFFDMGSTQDYADASQVISEYSAGGLGLPERDYYTRMDAKSVEQRRQYVAHVKNMLVLAGEAEAEAAKDADAILALETRLAKASLTVTQLREPQNLNHPTDVVSFDKQLTHFSVARYAEAAHAPAGGKMNETEPKFFVEFDAIIHETPLEQIRSYLRWHLLHAFAGTSMPAAFEHESWNFYSHTLNGAEKQQERWKRCTTRIDREMGEALGQVYVAKYFSPEDKNRALKMTIAIEEAMGKDIEGLAWMSPETKTKAEEKLHAVMNKIGYPDKWRDYSKLEIVRGDPLGNQARVREFNFDRQIAKIGKPVDKTEWYMSPPTVNAYYDEQQNNVNFPAGYFQPPFFSDKEDDAANYGDMGSTIGHELTHGFDDEGRQYDKDGNLKNWWTKDDEKDFNERAACMVKQYDAVEAVPGVHLNGKLTLGENMADLGGLWLAWIAWQDKSEAAHLDMDEKMDGYTPDQRFWISYAQQWCTQTRPEQSRTQAQTSPHAPDEYRSNLVLQDLPEFAKSFRCKKGDKMVAEKPCRVW